MAVTTLSLLKQRFETGDFPTEQQFADVFDSFMHKLDGIAIADVAGLILALQAKSEIGHQHTTAEIADLGGFLATWLSARLGVTVAPVVGGLIPSQYIAGQAKEVFFHSTLSAFPVPGQSDALYIARDTKVQYAWDGGASSYEIYSAPANPVWVNTGTPSINLGQFKTSEAATSGIGLTYQEFAEKLLFEAQPPTISALSHNAGIIAYRQQSTDIDVNWSYTAGANGGAVTNIKLEVSRNAGSTWVQLLSTSTSTTNFSHTGIAYSGGAAIRYQLTVTNAKGKSSSRILDVPYQQWAAPTISLELDRSGNREKGDMPTTLSGLITRKRTNVAITSYALQFRENGGGWQTLDTVAVSGNPAAVTIAAFTHNPTGLKNSANAIEYRCVVASDGEADATAVAPAVVFLFRSFFGSNTAGNLGSAQVVALGSGLLVTSRNRMVSGVTATGGAYTYYAYPDSFGQLIAVIMDGAAPVLGAFASSTLSVTNTFGVATSYQLYRSNATDAFSNNALAFS